MAKVILTILSRQRRQRRRLTNGSLTIGRGEDADVVIEDAGLSRLHATIHADGEKVWILDEGSKNWSYVNGQPVAATGAPLTNGARIEIGDETAILVEIQSLRDSASSKTTNARTRERWVPVTVALVLAMCMCVVAVMLVRGTRSSHAKQQMRTDAGEVPHSVIGGQPSPANGPQDWNSDERVDAQGMGAVAPTSRTGLQSGAGGSPAATAQEPGAEQPGRSQRGDGAPTTKLYLQMSREEQADYVARESEHIATMIGRRPCTFTPEVLSLIKYWVDAYARRTCNNQKGLWREDMRAVFKRATTYTPIVIREFRRRQINDVVGVYIPMIETEYNNVCYENRAGAMGLFQFTGPTAQALGVRPEDRCDVQKMAPIAARYIADRLSEFGTDAVGVSLAIAGYNRSPDSVRRDLYNVIDPNNRERSFWTLVANKAKLDQWFQEENVSYVPRFFAVAIIGENPWDFGINMRQLSSYTEPADIP